MALLQLEAIAFNHDPASATNDALNIRRNAALAIAAPEWQRGIGSIAPGPVAAYALEETRGRTLSIRARCVSSDPSLRRVEVRAVAGASLEQWPWNLTAPGASGPDAGVLGDVEARELEFGPSGVSEVALFNLARPQLERYGVGVHRVAWRWQFRRHGGHPWTTFAQSSVLVCVVLATPTAPWQQDGYPLNTQLPWADVLAYACRWASGTLNRQRVAARITDAVYQLGPELLEYNCPNMGAPMYVSSDWGPPPHYFNCSAFVERLRGGFGLGRFVNCSDCAAIVSTFANALGCDLSQSRMGFFPLGFALNPIVPIGAQRWDLPCGFWPGFGMHEVAWDGQTSDDDNIFDACLALDSDTDPTRAPHTPLVPANLRYGRPGDGLYRDRLIAPQDRELCRAMPETRQRRIVL